MNLLHTRTSYHIILLSGAPCSLHAPHHSGVDEHVQIPVLVNQDDLIAARDLDPVTIEVIILGEVDLLPLSVVSLLVLLLLDDELGVRVGVVDQTDLLLERKQSGGSVSHFDTVLKIGNLRSTCSDR